MKSFSINVDIDRVSFDELEFLGNCLGLSELASQSYECERNKEAGYVIVNCDPADPAGFWKNVQRYLQENPAVADACIVVCTGEQGWDDYSLLHFAEKASILFASPGEE